MANTKYPPIIVVDENDNEIGTAPLTEVWQKGSYHRIVSIFVKDSQGRMLLQLRGPKVKIYSNCWDQAAGGHVDKGFSYEQAAKAELSEELGLYDVALVPLGTFRSNNILNDGSIINQFERVYLAQIPCDMALKLNPEEIDNIRWFTSVELKEETTQHAERFSPGLLYALHKYFPDF